MNWENREQQTKMKKQISVGDVITVKHSGANEHGTLIFPFFIGKREDVSWDYLSENKSL